MKPKKTKREKMIKQLESLLGRRVREIRAVQERANEAIARIEQRNIFTRFKLEKVKSGEWPL